MAQRKATKKQIRKCKGFEVSICDTCLRQSDQAEEYLVMGIAHGKCVHYQN